MNEVREGVDARVLSPVVLDSRASSATVSVRLIAESYYRAQLDRSTDRPGRSFATPAPRPTMTENATGGPASAPGGIGDRVETGVGRSPRACMGPPLGGGGTGALGRSYAHAACSCAGRTRWSRSATFRPSNPEAGPRHGPVVVPGLPSARRSRGPGHRSGPRIGSSTEPEPPGTALDNHPSPIGSHRFHCHHRDRGSASPYRRYT